MIGAGTSLRDVVRRALDGMHRGMGFELESVVEGVLLVVAGWAIERGAMAPETFGRLAHDAFVRADLTASFEATRGEEPLNRTTSAHVALSRRTT